MPVQTRIQLRHDTAANWTSINPVLASGEVGVESDTRLSKIGDGSTAWVSLAYAADKSGLPTGGTAGQILAKVDGTNYNTTWIDNFSESIRHQVKAAVAINKGQPVYVSSADGTNMIASLASNDSEATSSKTMGLLDATVAINGFANVITEGLLAGLNTSTATAGDPVWLGASGALLYGLANKPVAPAHLVFIGIVTRVSATVGEIFVRPQNGFEIDELHDVLIANKTDGQVLTYEASSGLWKNKSVSGESFHPFLLMGA